MAIGRITVMWLSVLEEGLALYAGLVLLALLLPLRREQRSLRPLAHAERLTALPEYTRAVQLHRTLLIVTTACVLMVFGGALTAAARPQDTTRTRAQFEAEHAQDMMLCVGTAVTDQTASALLAYFQAKASGFEHQRIGLTSQTLRVLPLTADHEFAAARFGELAGLAGLAANAANGAQLSPEDTKALADGQSAFSRTVRYSDYQPNFIDTLARCVAGFPDFKQPSARRRSIVYLGPTDERPAAGTHTIYSSGSLAQLVQGAKAQVNVISLTSYAQSVAVNETETSGGKLFNLVDARALGDMLDQIAANPPALPAGADPATEEQAQDAPELALGWAVGFAALLSLCLTAVRR